MKKFPSFALVAIPLILIVRSLSPTECFLFLLSVLLHESGHFLLLYYSGYRNTTFSLLPGGAQIAIDTTFLPYKKEIAVYLAGPLFNALGMTFSFLLLRENFTFPLLYFFFCNALLCLINLIPVKGLDGYQALYSFLCLFQTPEKAGWILLPFNIIFSCALISAGLFFFFHEKNLSLLLLIISLLFEQKTKKATKIS